MSKKQDNKEQFITDEIDKIIVGRVKPHIYAFSTNTIPNYLKVGDTYRPVKIRLDEWRQKYANLSQEFDQEAMVSNDVFFRDYAIHSYLENDLGKKRLTQNDTPQGEYFSNEFFKGTSTYDIESAISDIKNDFKDKNQKYQYYSFEDRPTPVEIEYKSTGVWTPRPNQQEVIDNFKKAMKKGRTKLLLYAVMRFGKTFTSMCCANEMNAKIVLVVSAKADVKEEWKMTVQSADNFDEYVFIDSNKLKSDEKIIKKTISNNKKVVIFLTLQDLKDKNIKDKHKEVFSNKVDLLLVDETHFGARAETYGRVLRDQKEKTDDFVDFREATENIKILHPRITIHLSGTPYRILMTSEFEKDDIIGFYQASDILDAKKEWDEKHFEDIENQITNPNTAKPYQEWDNPYFGFPQMIRFAFTPSKRIRKRLEELQKQGIKWKFNEIFKPKSIKKQSDGSHKEFVYSGDILEFLKVIDGSQKDDSLLSFLDYDKIIDGSLCHHIVFVLPYRASCDALQKLIEDNVNNFHNLSNYKIINISGVDEPNKYSIKAVKRLISKAEFEGKKTITLTVNRMLTGSTVPEWDTMLYLKDTRSPQEYDQAIFRLQNQYVAKYKSTSDGEIIKYDKKPQTLLIDFSPNRVFLMQEERSLVYNANAEKKGKNALEDQISKDILYSPIIVLDKNRMKQVTATDLLSAIDNYSKNRGIYDETQEIPIDFGLLNDDEIRDEIKKQGEFRSKRGFEINPGEDDDEDINEPEDQPIGTSSSNDDENPTNPNVDDDNTDEQKTLERQFRTYYSRILFYSALTDDNIATLKEVINSIDDSNNNIRIAKNLNLKKDILQKILEKMDYFVGIKLDNTISRINRLSNDTLLTPLERAQTAIQQFDRLSESEIITGQNLCDNVIDLIDVDRLKNILKKGYSVLDIASKKAEFTTSLIRKLELNQADIKKYRNRFYSITTSKIAYEFTRKIYEILDLDTTCISSELTSYDVIRNNGKIRSEKQLINDFFNGEKNMHFDAVVGNPPYQINDGGNGISASPIYQIFVEQAKILGSNIISMIIPSRWFTGGKGLDDFREKMLNDRHITKIVDYVNSKDCFPGMSVGGGICYFVREGDKESDCEFTNVLGDKKTTSNRKLNEFNIFVRYNSGLSIIHKTMKDETIESIISTRNPFGIPSNGRGLKNKPKKFYTLYSREDITYIDKNKISGNKKLTENVELANNYKVMISRFSAEHAGEPDKSGTMKVLSRTQILNPGEICTDTYIVGGNYKTKEEAKNLMNYLNTKFARYLLLQGIASISVTRERFCFVPNQDFTKEWTDKKLYKKYGLSKDEINTIERTIR